MPRSISAFIAEDGTVFSIREEAEKHEIRLALREKFGEQKAVQLDVFVDQRSWFEELFAKVRKELPTGIHTEVRGSRAYERSSDVFPAQTPLTELEVPEPPVFNNDVRMAS